MSLSATDQLSVSFAAALGSGAAQPDAPASLLGLEHEYSLSDGGGGVDFRQIIHGLAVPGRRLDYGDRNAYRCRSGLVITCDEAEAEVASPPVRLRRGFARRVEGWGASGYAELSQLLPQGVEARGYSTHLSAAMPEALNDRVAEVYARTFAPALMLLMDGPESHGIYVRPRAGRLELCGEYVQGARLGAAAAFLAGSARACAGADSGELPPRLKVRVVPATNRYGLYVGRHAFGGDLYAEGRRALLTRENGGTITAQEHLEIAWQAASGALVGIAAEGDLGVAERMVAGSLPLGVEGDVADFDDATAAHSRSPVHGAVLEPVMRPGFGASAVMAVWPFTVFRLKGTGRTAYACVPRDYLPQFLRGLRSGRLDAQILEYLGSAPAGRVLASHRQTDEPGLWDEVGEPRELLPPERDESGSYQTLDAESDRAGKRGRPGKVLVVPVSAGPVSPVPPVAPPPPPPGGRPSKAGGGPPWKIILPLIAVIGAVAIGVGVVLAGGSSSGDSSPTPTSSDVAPSSTPTATAVVVVPTDRPTGTGTGTPTATPTGSSSPTATATPTTTPEPTSTPTPTVAALCDLTIAKTSDPGNGLITYEVRVEWVCPAGVDTTTGSSVHVDDALPLQTSQQPYSPIQPPQVTTDATSGAIGCSGPPHAHPGAPGFDTSRFGCDVGVLPANGSATITVTLDIGAGNDLTNTAVVDTDDGVPESNEGNNQAQVTDIDCCQ